MTDKPTPEMFAACAALISDVGPVRMTGRHDQLKYQYLSEQDVVQAVRGAMAARGLCLLPVAVADVKIEDAGQSRGGNVRRLTTLVQRYVLGHSSGGWLTIEVAAQAMDHEDKGAAKAGSGAYREALRRIAMIASTDDVEATTHEPPEATVPPPVVSPVTVPPPAAPPAQPSAFAVEADRRQEARGHLAALLTKQGVPPEHWSSVIQARCSQMRLPATTWDDLKSCAREVPVLRALYVSFQKEPAEPF